MSVDTAEAEEARGATAMLEAILDRLSADARATPPEDAPAAAGEEAGEPRVTLGALFDRMEERAFGLMLLILALPCCLPFVYLLPQLVAAPMILLATQMATGRHAPWLPQKIRERSFPIASLRDVVQRSKRYVGWFEALARPRLLGLTSHKAARIVGVLLVPPTASILVPLPLTNTIPGIGVAITSVGLIERDGLLVILGLIVGLGWVLLLLVGGPAFLAWLFAAVSGLF